MCVKTLTLYKHLHLWSDHCAKDAQWYALFWLYKKEEQFIGKGKKNIHFKFSIGDIHNKIYHKVTLNKRKKKMSPTF